MHFHVAMFPTEDRGWISHITDVSTSFGSEIQAKAEVMYRNETNPLPATAERFVLECNGEHRHVYDSNVGRLVIR